jgi:hypothetical protein
MRSKKIGIIISMMLLITSLSVSASIEEELTQSDYLIVETEEILLLIDQCIVPDNGEGTADLPADCPYESSEDPFYIIDGLPPGTTIELEPIFDDFYNIVRTPGGPLGGEILEFDATLELVVTGTGDLTGFNRFLSVPVSFEINTASRTPGDPVQSFLSEIFQLEGELFGDPDFCMFRIYAGEVYGLPSPGQFILSKMLSGNFNIDSFFDITYQIEFEGCPGSPLDDYMGTTVDTTRLQQGIEFLNDPPSVPTIDGPINGKVGVSYPYNITSIDPDGDDVSYFIRWGDGEETDWTTFQASGPPGYTESHSWDTQGTYIIQAKAKDIYGVESDLETLTVTIPRNKGINNLFLNWLQSHPFLFPLLQKIIQHFGL